MANNVLQKQNLAEIPFINLNPHCEKNTINPRACLRGRTFFQGTSESNTEPETINYTEAALPDDVKAVVDKKCYGCHNTNSQNEKGKAKLDWEALDKILPASPLTM